MQGASISTSPAMRHRLSRRRLLALGAAASPWALAVVAGASGAEAARRLFRDPAAARAVGRAYLAADPAARSGAERIGRVLTRAWAAGPGRARRTLAAELRRSWREDEVVVVDGWVLARAEADLCALAAG